MAEDIQCDEINDSPIEQVRVSIPITDDDKQLTLTFRTWVLGILSCCIQAGMTGFSRYRQYIIYIPGVCIQLAVLPIGKFMAATLPTKSFRIPFTKWSFSMNPGPFSVKEHALIYIFAGQGQTSPFLLDMIAIIRAYYHRNISFLQALLQSFSSNLIGYGFAGLLEGFLVDSPYMWWPEVVASVVMFQTLHESNSESTSSKGKLTKMQFFIIAFVCSFSYQIVPGYFFPSITTLSIVCWFWKDSVTAQQIGAARNGLGLGSIALDWSTWIPDPLITPQFSLHNTMAGFVIFFYIIVPIAYWNNLYDAKRFPIFTSNIFDENGHKFNVSQVIDPKTLRVDQTKYDNYSKMHLSVFYALSYGCLFASVSSSITHVALYNGRTMWRRFKEARAGRHGSGDVHNRLMKKYDPIPKWWFLLLLIASTCVGIFICTFGQVSVRLPIWFIPLACGVGLTLALLTGTFQAIANQSPPFSLVSEIIVGYLVQGKPIANMLFRNYSIDSMWSAVSFLSNFKFGHYMKIPPRSMFKVQVIGTMISFLVDYQVSWYLLSTVPNICDTSKLPEGSPWTCPNNEVANDITTIWGVVGPARLFAPYGLYGKMYLFFLVGAISTLLMWKLSRMYPEKKWIELIYVPLIFGTVAGMPPTRPVQIWSGWIVGVLYYLIVYRKFKWWWEKYTYVLSNGLSAGVAVLGLAVYVALQMHDINGVDWWGLSYDDHCPLAHCPTALGILVEGCPVFN